MAEKDQQHFLPKSYLTNFSNFSNNKEMGIYHPVRKLYMKSGKLKTQCRKLKYYGDDKITENKLMHLEGDFKKLMLKIIRTKYIPKLETNEYDELIHLMLVTELRNPIIAEGQLKWYEMVNKLNKSRFPDKLQPIAQVPEGFNSPSMFVDIANDAIPFIRDLRCALLINETPYPFITSDNPVIKYNQFAESFSTP